MTSDSNFTDVIEGVLRSRKPQESNRREFVARAACGNADPKLFDTGDTRRPSEIQRRRIHALGICAGCPVQRACLDDQLQFEMTSSDRPSGIVGGLLPEQRARILRRRGKYLSPTVPVETQSKDTVKAVAA